MGSKAYELFQNHAPQIMAITINPVTKISFDFSLMPEVCRMDRGGIEGIVSSSAEASSVTAFSKSERKSITLL